VIVLVNFQDKDLQYKLLVYTKYII